MSVLLIGLPIELESEVVRRLTSQGDGVRVLTRPGRDVGPLKSAGAYVALGFSSDDDLVERAATNCRTVVVGDDGLEDLPAIADGIRRSKGIRLVVCTSRPLSDLASRAGIGDMDALTLITGRRKMFRRSEVPVRMIAEAIDAADDIAEPPTETVDLTSVIGWEKLNLRPPG